MRIEGLGLLVLALAACTSHVSNEGDDGTEDGGAAAGGGQSAGGENTGGAPAVCDPPADVAAFAIGTGEKCFETLVDGQTVPLVSGPQGGYHIWLAVGCADCAASVTFEFGVRDPATGDTFPNTYPSEAVINLSNQPWRQAAGMFVGMPGLSWDPENEPPPPPGTHVLLWGRVSGAVVHESAIEVIVGETISWDPCIENPNDPNCTLG